MKNIFIIVPAYNAAKKIVSVFERIPKEIWDKEVRVIIVNDGSVDDTRIKIGEIQKRWAERITVIDKSKNEGYAKAQKDGFSKAFEMGADIGVLLHSATSMLRKCFQSF